MLAMDVWCFSKSTARIDLEKHQTRLHYWGISLCNFGESPLQFWVFLLYTKQGKLGIKISTDENVWRIGSLHFEPAQTEYNFLIVGDDEEIDQQIIDTANWSLTPLLDNYHIWLDDVVDYSKIETERESIDLCYVTDSNSGTH